MEKAKKVANRPFKRIDDKYLNKVKDYRLADNSYESLYARGGAAYAYKANQKLSVTRGKGFRHEKTKQKRGNYRGGKIDSNSVHSITFDDDSSSG